MDAIHLLLGVTVIQHFSVFFHAKMANDEGNKVCLLARISFSLSFVFIITIQLQEIQ